MNRLIILLLVLFSRPVSAQVDSIGTMAQAEAAYVSGDYQSAVSLYESLLLEGLHDPTVYFNLGNAYYAVGDLGRALLNYRRTQLSWPRDTDLNHHLSRILAERIDLQGDENGFGEGLAAYVESVMTLSELSIAVGLIWGIWFGIVTGMLLYPSVRKRLKAALIIVGCFLLIGVTIMGNSLVIESSRPRGVVINSVVSVMSGPGNDYMELFELHAGADIRVWEVRNGWVQFALPDGRLGWLDQDAVGFVD